jgi:hypothetical protein
MPKDQRGKSSSSIQQNTDESGKPYLATTLKTPAAERG